VGRIEKVLQKYRAECSGIAPSDAEAGLPQEASILPLKFLAAPEAGLIGVSDSAVPQASAGKLPDEASSAALAGSPAAAPGPSAQSEKACVAVIKDRGLDAPLIKAVAPALDKALHEPQLGSVRIRRDVDPCLVSLVKPDGFEAELFRSLRTRILFPQTGQSARTILVASALPEEGKSFVAANLAINMASALDQHVLLVDCDLRKPSIHTKFGLNGLKGLSEYLSAGLDLSALLVKTELGKFTLLPSGDLPQNPSELLTSSKMAALIQELKARYHDRYIILDSPPLMMAPETGAIAKWVDSILIVVKYGNTPMDLVEEMINLLDREKIIGAVINQFNLREFRRYSYKKYYKYGKYRAAYYGRRPSGGRFNHYAYNNPDRTDLSGEPPVESIGQTSKGILKLLTNRLRKL